MQPIVQGKRYADGRVHLDAFPIESCFWMSWPTLRNFDIPMLLLHLITVLRPMYDTVELDGHITHIGGESSLDIVRGDDHICQWVGPRLLHLVHSN